MIATVSRGSGQPQNCLFFRPLPERNRSPHSEASVPHAHTPGCIPSCLPAHPFGLVEDQASSKILVLVNSKELVSPGSVE